MNLVTRSIYELQENTLLAARAFRSLFSKPRYFSETIAQMDTIGVGSLSIILLTGFFTGGVLTVQTFPTLAFWGQQGQHAAGEKAGKQNDTQRADTDGIHLRDRFGKVSWFGEKAA